MNTASTIHSLKVSFLARNLGYLLAGGYRIRDGHRPPALATVPADFFGICVAASPDPASDSWLIDHLRRLGISCVRLDWTYASVGAHTERLLAALIENDFKVCLHLVQPFSQAQHMHQEEMRQRWEAFVSSTADTWGRKLDMVEVGATCNRRKWAGYTLHSFLDAWEIAYDILREKNITIAGPNVTDFEPVYNIGLLAHLQQTRHLPDIHTNNLFAERATEPERFDHKIAGHRLARVVKYNLIKKARLLKKIGDDFSVPRTFSTHAAWSLRRIDRVLADLEGKQADYVTRYCCLMAAAGSIDRVYWGPLVGQREGLIDDGTTAYPDIPHVTAYLTVPGRYESYRVRVAFNAFATVIKNLADTCYTGARATGDGVELHTFATTERITHVGWTINGRCAKLSDCYPEQALAGVRATDRDGQPIPVPSLLTEQPVYLHWPAGTLVDTAPPPQLLSELSIHVDGNTTCIPVETERWSGMCAAPAGATSTRITPELLEGAAGRNVMRDRRNCVWSMAHPERPDRQIVVKRLQIKKLHKRIIQRWRTPRAQKSWNGAHELLRRGVTTPRPIAYFNDADQPRLGNGYFVYEMFDGQDSVRTVFDAFTRGDEMFRGVGRTHFFEALSAFLLNMHNRGVFFRDLSAGNILLRVDDETKKITFSLIDTARGRFYEHPVSFTQRLSDLKRIVHPLHWPGRNLFIGTYLKGLDKAFAWWMRIPFLAYDVKHAIKKLRKRK